jgi:hypothetical protein
MTHFGQLCEKLKRTLARVRELVHEFGVAFIETIFWVAIVIDKLKDVNLL